MFRITILYTRGAAESIEVENVITEEVDPEVIEDEGWVSLGGSGVEASYVDHEDVVGLVRVM